MLFCALHKLYYASSDRVCPQCGSVGARLVAAAPDPRDTELASLRARIAAAVAEIDAAPCFCMEGHGACDVCALGMRLRAKLEGR